MAFAGDDLEWTQVDIPTMPHHQDGDFTEQSAASFDDRTWTTALTITPDTGQLWTVGTHVDEQGYPTGGVSSHTE